MQQGVARTAAPPRPAPRLPAPLLLSPSVGSHGPLHLRARSAARRVIVVPQAAAGGGAGSIGGSGKVTGGGGGGGGGSGGSGKQPSNEPEDSGKSSSQKGGIFQGWQERVAADPEFPIKVLMEQVIGVGATVIGDMSARPNWGLNELDFIFSTVVVGSLMNFSIMYLLAPTASSAAAGTASIGLIARLLGDTYLKKWGAPGGNMFEPGPYGVGKRLLNFGYKGTVFAVIGFFSGVFGTSLSNGLLALRKRFDPEFKLQNEQPNIVYNALTWAVHMGVSANLRYQVLGGIDTVLVKAMPIGPFRVYQALIRAANNTLGGISFATLARVTGVQKSAAPPLPPVVATA